MCVKRFLFLVIFSLSLNATLPGIDPGEFRITHINNALSVEDTLKENQLLYNGRVWRNRYYRVKGDQFLISRDFSPGSITICGKTYDRIDIRYDIYNDEIMIPSNNGIILQINKEMVDSFSISYLNDIWKFVNIRGDSLKGFSGYFNILYDGQCKLYVKYKKEIDLLAVDKKYDQFYQLHRIYLLKEGVPYLLTSKYSLLNLLGDDKKTVKNYISKNRLILFRKNPHSFIPVIQYLDGLR